MKHYFATTTFLLLLQSLIGQISGCTDLKATNYNENATQNDGSCVYATTSISPQSSVNLGAELVETSGLILFNDVLWSHNDNDDTQLYQINPTTGATISTINIPNVSNVDWEDIAADEHYIYLGDFGNNATGIRTDLKIYRFPKSEWENPTTIDTIRFSYSTQTDFSTSSTNATNFDCEAFIVSNDKIYLFTKEWTSNATSIFELEKTPGNHVANFQSTLNVQGLITGATYLEEKQLVVLSGYSSLLQPFIYLLYDFESTNFFSGNKRKINLNLSFHQVEGIVTKDGLNYYLTNEQLVQTQLNIAQKLHTINLSNFLLEYLFPEVLNVESQVKSFNLQVYPNPFENAFYVKYDSFQENEMVKLELIDLTGKSLYRSELNASFQHFDLSELNLESGLYQIIFSNSNSFSKQIMSILKE